MNKKFPTWLIVLIVIAVLLIIFVFVTPSNDNSTTNTQTTATSSQLTTKSTTQKIETVKTNAYSLISAYQNNESTADDKFKNKNLVVKYAIVNEIKDNYVELECDGNGYWFDYIDAYYNSDEQDNVNSLNKGDTVTVNGYCIGLSDWGNVKLRNSTFEK
jgi:preprotein translocase subunit SecG